MRVKTSLDPHRGLDGITLRRRAHRQRYPQPTRRKGWGRHADRPWGGDDTLLGRSGADDLDGGPGNDQLRGSSGNDLLIGGSDDDRVVGNAGADEASFVGARRGVTADLVTHTASGEGGRQADRHRESDRVAIRR